MHPKRSPSDKSKTRNSILRTTGSRLKKLGDRVNRIADTWDFRARYPRNVEWLRDLEPAVAQGIGDRWQQTESNRLRLTVAAVSYKQPKALRTFLYSMECQTLLNFCIHILHDGPHQETYNELEHFAASSSLNLQTTFTSQRFNDWGHSLRSIAIEQAETDFLLITNADNYYAPKLAEYAFDVIDSHKLDLLHFDMAHSHDHPGGRPQRSYQSFATKPFNKHIDIGTCIVRTEIAKEIGYRHRSYNADGLFIEDLLSSGRIQRVGQMSKILLMHN